MSDHRVHPDNTLNELSGEEWLYFTKSLLTTAYPSELGHAARRVHGANKPRRRMARRIELLRQSGLLVVGPLGGVGGTLGLFAGGFGGGLLVLLASLPVGMWLN